MTDHSKQLERETEYLLSVLEKTRSRLLDTSRRNRLLNYRESARDVAIIDEMPDQIFEHLYHNGGHFYFDAYSEEASDQAQTSLLIREHREPDRTLPASAHTAEGVDRRYTDNRLQTPFGEKELERRLRKLYLEHRTIIGETGANNLYLAIGFLQWHVSPVDRLALRSPLMLLPVRLEKERGPGVATYRMVFDDQALDTNYSLLEKLKNDFDITLPRLQEGQSPEDYWQSVEAAVAPMREEGWTLLREVALGLFRFSKQVMWHDLDPGRWPKHTPLTDKAIIRRILVGPGEGEAPPGQLIHEYSPDDDNGDEAVPDLSLIRDADSSQFAALVDGLGREDGLVIEGPPGTGKSQTIANLIATALDQGLSVLFVAEKMAALKVVYDRLAKAGLDHFCLQLHGLKTSKKELLQSVTDRINHRVAKPGELASRKQELETIKKELIEFSHALSEPVGPEQLPLHRLAWRVELLRQSLPDGFQPLSVENPAEITLEAFHRARNLLNDLGREWAAIPPEARAGWRGFLPQEYDDSQEPRLRETIDKAIQSVERLVAWLEAKDTADVAPSLSEVWRLLALGDVDPAQAMPPYPAGADLALAHTVLSGDLLGEFGALIQQIDAYLQTVAIVSTVFDYQADESPDYAEKLQLHAGQLINVACKEDVTIGQLASELDTITQVITHLRSLPEIAEPVTQLTDGIARTLDDYCRLDTLAAELAQGPVELSLHGTPIHARAPVRNYLAKAWQEFEALTAQAAALSAFSLDRATDTVVTRDAYEYLLQCRGKRLVLFDGRYREAKRRVRSLLRDPRSYSRKPDFLERLGRLVDFCDARDRFAADDNFSAALGPLFKGIETDWDTLERLISFAQNLREQVGLERARGILVDWDTHAERMLSVQEKLRVGLEEIQQFREIHPFPDALWQRPVTEIATTLEPWKDKIQAAVDRIAQPWCQGDVSLRGALECVEAYNRARIAEQEIEGDKHFDPLIRPFWERAATRVDALHTVHTWLEERLEFDGINLEILRWLMPSDDNFLRDRFITLQGEAKTFRQSVTSQISDLEGFGGVVLERWLGGPTASLADFGEKLRKCTETFASVPLMVRWHLVHKQVCALGLEPFSELVSSGDLVGDQCGKAFEFSVYSRLVAETVARDPKLAAFGHIRYEHMRERFADLDKSMYELNAQQIAARLCKAPVPQGVGHGPVRDYTEKELLLREAGKKTKHIPIRQLVRRAGNALQALKPCFLMSPLSVAQYLPPGEIEFDLIVMDEASQIRPEDALGAIARGRKAIIVGDPKQLPPTSFFDTAVAEDEEAEETILDDAESILDVSLTRLPYRRLRWHYRSQHESLIHFSNERFYQGKLFVFPSPKGTSREFGVHSTFVNTPSYRKGGSNRGEAEIVVENIFRHFHRYRRKSLGVAAFNKRHAEEIQLLLDKARQDDPAVDDLIANHEAKEPLFIKNLENVQGDERDVIFISTTYGPEKPGDRVFQRFWPLNSDLGWRRLNVIVTRARQRVEVFTSMRPQDILIGGNARRGVRELRNYLEYAATGRVTEHGVPTGRAPESEFEEAVAKILENLGYECEPQVGVSGFYIDLGVRHPDRPGEYLMGVECDGATYHSAKSVRDRDRLRQEILESKGWFIHRIWSTSWFHTRAAEIDRLKRALDGRLEEDRRLWDQIADYQEEAEVVSRAHRASREEVAVEVAEVSESLEEALERFWEKNICPQFPERRHSILSEEMIGFLVDRRPESEEQWFRAVPINVRQSMDPRQRELLPDILDVIAEYV